MIDLTMYHPIEIEEKINLIYKNNGLYSTTNLSIENISSVFKIDVQYYVGPSCADWEGDPVIFLDSRLSLEKKREIFFHEISHLLLHVGNQDKMHSLFKELQENQANSCQLYAAMPIYMFEEFQGVPYSSSIEVMSNRFMLPSTLVRERLEQIKRRISRAHWDHQVKEQLQKQYRKADPANYSKETKDLLDKLYHQLNKKGAAING
jgi:Zn-dependent peptidase ImmA (M78 family)